MSDRGHSCQHTCITYTVITQCWRLHWMWASITDGGLTLTQLWIRVSYWTAGSTLCYTSPPLNGNVSVYRALAWCWAIVYTTWAQHLNDIGSVSACTVRTQWRQHKHCPVLSGFWPATVDQHWTGIRLVSCWLVVDTNISWKLWCILNKTKLRHKNTT